MFNSISPAFGASKKKAAAKAAQKFAQEVDKSFKPNERRKLRQAGQAECRAYMAEGGNGKRSRLILEA